MNGQRVPLKYGRQKNGDVGFMHPITLLGITAWAGPYPTADEAMIAARKLWWEIPSSRSDDHA